MAPAARMVSRRAVTVTRSEALRKVMPVAVLAVDETARFTPFDQAVGDDRQVRSRHGRAKKRLCRAYPDAAALVHLKIRGAEVVATVEFGDLRNPALLGSVSPSVEDRPIDAPLLYPQFVPACRFRRRCAVEFVRAVLVVLRAFEDRQHVVPTPAAIAEFCPVVVVARLSAHVDHRVDRRAAAEHLATGVADHATVQARLRHRFKAPVGTRIADGEQVADRDVDPEVVVLAAGFD